MTRRGHDSELGKAPGGKDSADLRSAFDRQVLHGLAAEWENARWQLPDPLRQQMRPPLFAIRKMPSRWGSWDPTKREITLSQDLVANHGWDDIREVLLHEMAHQLVHEGLAVGAETAHGDGFKQACRFLQANPRASGTYPTLHQRLQRGDPLDDNDHMVMKIHKLMALAESSNLNEAHAAMRKAYALMARHNIDLIRHGHRHRYTSIFLGRPRLRHFREAYHLAHLLQDFYFVQGVWVQAWVLGKTRMGRVLEISGTPSNVLIAEHVHTSVCRYIDNAWADYRRDKALNRYRKTDFAVGVIEGFRGTLEEATDNPRQSDAPTNLPMRVDDRALTRYLARRYPHLRRFSRKGPGHDSRVLADGTECGKKLVVAKGIHHHEGIGDRALVYHGKGNP